MPGTICIFEDDKVSNLFPLTYLRPVYDLRCGILTLRKKLEHSYPGASVTLHCRSYLADVTRERHPGVPINAIGSDKCLFLNGRLIAHPDLVSLIPLEGEDTLYYAGDDLVAARVSDGRSIEVGDGLRVATARGIRRQSVDVLLAKYPWDLVGANGKEIEEDFNRVEKSPAILGKVYEGVHVLNKPRVLIGGGSKIKPGVVLDAESGPIYIGENVTVMPNSMIEGPVFIGDGSIIKAGAKIYGNTSIGPMCKVGGEVEGSIIHSYSNKQHDGFLGHSYLGMWVNLGADTNNSDLKNNYGHVKVVINGKTVDSGSMFVGLTMGDHSKAGINTMFNTGTVVGVSSNIFGGGFPPKAVPSFSWGGADGLEPYDLEKSIAVARTVMARRKVELTSAEEKLLRVVHGTK